MSVFSFRACLAIALSLFAFPLVAQTQAPGEGALPEAPAGAGQQRASADDIAKQLTNPVANLITVPFQYNFDTGSGPDGEGKRHTINIQPVIPFSLNEDWQVITRTIMPVITQNDEVSALSDDEEFGIGDTLATFFFSPKEPTMLNETAGLVWGVGPAFYLPTATEDVFGADQWGLGPSAVLLVMDGHYTYGMLTNHIWSLGKTRDFDSFIVERSNINSTLFQPFFSYTPGGGWSYTTTAEASFDWEADQWTIPVGVYASKVFSVNGQPMSLQAGPRVYLDGPDSAPDWGFRISLNFVFPQ